MDIVLAKIIATALVFSQVATAPSQLRTKFDETHDEAVVTELLRSGCAHMRKAFDVEDLNLDDLIATAMEDVDALVADQAVLRGVNVKHLHVVYRQFCKNENVLDSPISLAEVIRFYNSTLADLPSSIPLANLTPPGMTKILDVTGEQYHQRRALVPLEMIPTHVQQAFVAAEDKRFYEHKGIDDRGLVRAFIANFANAGRLQGGSTITQQVVKNILVGGEVSYERKMREMVLASRLEDSVGKSKILELYLNSIYFGRGAWGIETASQSYFGKSAPDLDVTEAALLAGLVKGPTSFSPERHPDRSRQRTEYVLNRLHEDNHIDSETLKAAVAKLPLNLLAYEGLPQGSHFVDHLAREAKALAKADVFAGEAYTIHATIHPKLQRAAEASLQEGLSRYERSAARVNFQGPETNLADVVARLMSDETADRSKPSWQNALEGARLPLQDLHWVPAIVIEERSGRGSRSVRVGLADGRILPLSLGAVPASKLKMYDVVRVRLVETRGKASKAELRVAPTVQGAAVVLENRSGRILAMTGGFSYSLSQLNRVTQSQRQPGSALKPLVYLAALQRGLQPNTLVRDDAITYPPIGGSRKARPEDFWSPKNYDGSEGGALTIRQALQASKNLPTARLLDAIEASPPQSLDSVCRLAQHLKIYKDCIKYYPFVLGAQPVRPIDLAVFYATIANEGFRPSPYSIDTVSRNNQTSYRHEATLEEVTLADRVSFYQLKTMLQGVLAQGTASSLSHMAPYVAGKTGTTDGENDVWFVGFSNEVTIAVWVGYDNADGRRRTLGSGRTGGNVAIPIFEPIMQAVWTHLSPKSVLKAPSPEAQRHLVTTRGQQKTSKSAKAVLLTEYLRKDAKGRAVESQYKLLSRADHETVAPARSAKRRPPQAAERRRPPQPAEKRFVSGDRNDQWSHQRDWFGRQRSYDGQISGWFGRGGFW